MAIEGDLDNSFNTFDIDASTGDLVLRNGGEIVSGFLTQQGGFRLIVGPRGPSTLATPDNVLDDVTITGDLDLATLKTRLSEKWNTYPSDIHPAWVAEMDFRLAEPIRRVLERAVDLSDIGYPIAPHETGLREAFCDRMQRLYDWPLEPRRVEILTDVV